MTGTTALNIDTADQLAAALPRYVIVVVGLALLLLTVVFRSLYVPIKAAFGFLLSIAASMGVVVWIFQDGNLAELFNVAQPGPVLSFLPVLLIGILFGLAMDYEVFLVSRMREHFVHTGKAREAVITGYAPERPGRHRRGDDHDRRLRGVHPRPEPDHEVDRVVAGVRRAGRRVRRPPHARARRHDPARASAPGACPSGSSGSCPTSTSRASGSPPACTRPPRPRSHPCPMTPRAAGDLRRRPSSSCRSSSRWSWRCSPGPARGWSRATCRSASPARRTPRACVTQKLDVRPGRVRRHRLRRRGRRPRGDRGPRGLRRLRRRPVRGEGPDRVGREPGASPRPSPTPRARWRRGRRGPVVEDVAPAPRGAALGSVGAAAADRRASSRASSAPCSPRASLARAALVVTGSVLSGLVATAIVQSWLDVVGGDWAANAGVAVAHGARDRLDRRGPEEPLRTRPERRSAP